MAFVLLRRFCGVKAKGRIFMKIEYKNIVLRDEVIADIEDDIRWNTVETEWSLWDAPWETEEYLRNFDPEKFREEELKRLACHARGRGFEPLPGRHFADVAQ